MNSRNAVLAAAVSILMVVLVGCAGRPVATEQAESTGSLPSKGDLLFVLRGDGQVADGRLTVDANQAEWFTDRPDRRAGFADAHDLVSRWGRFGFSDVPPNAALTGEGLDAVVELTHPRGGTGGTSFAVETVRGQVGNGSLGPVTLFIDGTGPVHTRMNVRAQGAWCSNPARSRLSNPQIVHAPAVWYVLPEKSVRLGDQNGDGVINGADRVTLFIAGSANSRSNFEVSYTASCGHSRTGTVTLTGSIPTAWYNAKRFSCNYADLPGARCDGFTIGVYHPRGIARIGN